MCGCQLIWGCYLYHCGTPELELWKRLHCHPEKGLPRISPNIKYDCGSYGKFIFMKSMDISLLISVLWSFRTGRLISFLRLGNKSWMLFPVSMEGISRAVNSWTQLSDWHDGRPVVRYEVLMMGSQGTQTVMNSVKCCWDDYNPAGDQRHEGHCRHELVCVFSCVIPTPESQNTIFYLIASLFQKSTWCHCKHLLVMNEYCL